MPRYIVERRFAAGEPNSLTDAGPRGCAEVIERNADGGVTWVHSYVARDGDRTFCVCDAPTPEAIRRTARRNGLPVDRITEVLVLDPYAYR